MGRRFDVQSEQGELMLCPHQARDARQMFFHARQLGRRCRVTSEVRTLGLTTLMPCDLNAADRAKWREQYVRLLLSEDIIEARCPTCGHEAVQ
jgi:hypothetical protein